MRRGLIARLLAAGVATLAAPALAQAPPQPPASTEQPPAPATLPLYKPPLRGAPGGRVGGASRSAVLHKTPLPVIELLAPADQSGVSARAEPVLYYFISAPSRWPMQFTISAPRQPAPVVEVAIPAATAPGVYALPTAQYRVRLQPGITYTWSVSIVLDPRAWSHNVVASASIEVDPTLAPALPPALTPTQRTVHLAQAGLWYDAVAAAVDEQDLDRHSALDALIQEAGLREAAAFEQRARIQ